MLPDYPKLKDELLEIYREFVRRGVQFHKHSPVTSEDRLFEGTTSAIIREDGEEDLLDMRTSHASCEINLNEIPRLSIPDILGKLDDVAKSIAEQQGEHFLESMHETCEKVGNIVDCGGSQLTPEHILDILRKIRLEFDTHGKPKFPCFMAGEKVITHFEKILKQIICDPALAHQLEEVIAGKREEWRDRETSRELAG